MKPSRLFGVGVLMTVSLFFFGHPSFAGIFNTVHFVDPGKTAIGVEPELILSDGAGLGFNAKFTYGLNDLMNAAGFIGDGGGPRNFRIGGDLVFDFFPDVDRQPGIGLLTRAVYYRIPDTGRLDIIGAPYIHKALLTGNGQDVVDPFLAIPIGMAFSDGNYHATSQLVLGAMFMNGNAPQWRYSMELGLNLNDTETYISGGVTFYP